MDATSRPMPGQDRLLHLRTDRLNQLRAFFPAARLRNICRAAERIASTPPAVSQHVRALEEDLAVALFGRSGARTCLTPAGERFHVGGWSAITHCVEAGVGTSAVPESRLTERDRAWRIPATKFLPSRFHDVLTQKGGLLSLAAGSLIRTIDDIPPHGR